MVFSLALVHHLFINNNLSFTQISLILSNFSTKYVIVEYIPVEDNKVQTLIKGRSINLNKYNDDYFIMALSKYFLIKETISLKDTGRRLFLIEKRK